MSAMKQLIQQRHRVTDRSLLKTATFAITHFTVAFSVAYLLTGDLLIGGLIAMVEPAINTVAYFVHEQVWLRLDTAAGSRARGPGETADTADTAGVLA
ncbi:DUF2061 domain-containing protein [Marinobacter sp. SS21]|uniref:DUF2061 domain-containing protein n=1 Tax=Marinobacter sp. SS21 TaxID=2979460 RepID=UPI00232CA697|nr:DUF2061 domain-containing protein [Marinobacter sp. SS21]MDC0662353.1 DUF2061 domain-containing protein [Marinobacter sp. SS21]